MGTVYDALNKEQREMKRVATAKEAAGELAAGEERKHEDFFIDADPHLILHREAHPAAVEQFKTLRTRLFFQREDAPRTLLVASAVTGEGKTLVAANLALALALSLEGDTVLVDCDLRRPALGRFFGVRERRGLADCLSRGERAEDVVVRTPLPRLLLIPGGGRLQSNAPELLGSARMAEFFADLRSLFPNHRVVCDCPPLSAGPDAAILARYVDGVLVVVMAHEAGREEVARSLDLLGKEKLLGIVFNGSEAVGGRGRFMRSAA
ncbi:MAG: CpsD/CapB family tyrosine-protein kinase [Pseudomonadota bacterium]